MKRIIFFLLAIAGCAVLNRPEPRPVDIIAEPPVIVEAPKEVTIPQRTMTRFVLEEPQQYARLLPRVEKAFLMAVEDPTFFTRTTFYYTSDSVEQIKAKIRQGFNVTLRTYRPTIWQGGKWSDVTAYHSNGTIYLNSFPKFMNRDDCEIINTLVHEPMHNLGYTHGGNKYTPDMDNSVPYWMGDRAQELCEQGKI